MEGCSNMDLPRGASGRPAQSPAPPKAGRVSVRGTDPGDQPGRRAVEGAGQGSQVCDASNKAPGQGLRGVEQDGLKLSTKLT